MHQCCVFIMQVEYFFKKIREAGGRMTLVRKAMVGIFVKEARPLSLRTITAMLSKKKINIDRTTIYRELVFLTENKVISTINLGDSQKYYEIFFHHHHHLVCTACNFVGEVVLDPCLKKYENKFLKEKNFQVVSHSLEFYGLCEKCQ